MTTAFNRRRAVTGAAAVAVGGPLLAACGGDEVDTATDPSGPTGSTTSPSEGAGDAPEETSALASVSDVPVNGCFVVTSAQVVLTQPSQGDIKAFSATCTHQGCAVSSASDGVIPCRCHGSEFSLEDGSVVTGPATAPLGEVAITVQGDSISLA